MSRAAAGEETPPATTTVEAEPPDPAPASNGHAPVDLAELKAELGFAPPPDLPPPRVFDRDAYVAELRARGLTDAEIGLNPLPARNRPVNRRELADAAAAEAEVPLGEV